MVNRYRGRARSDRRRWRTPRVSSARQRWGRRRATGCLLWIVGLIVVLIILSLLFGGFQMGTKAGGAGVLAPQHFGALIAGGGR
jgi:hypothetical protein